MPESPRWHEGRLWFSNWGTRQIVAVDRDGNSDVVAEGPDGLGWGITVSPVRPLLNLKPPNPPAAAAVREGELAFELFLEPAHLGGRPAYSA
jgi:hypothetical protein